MLPVIDFAAAAAPAQTANSIGEIGFAALRRAPIDPDLLTKIAREWSRFFESDGKHRYRARDDAVGGYFPYVAGPVAGGRRDRKEFFHVQPGGPYPSEVSSAALVYFEQASAVGRTVLGWLDAERASDFRGSPYGPLPGLVDGSTTSVLRVQRYLASGEEADPQRIRALAHTDINLLTVLPAPTDVGLQLRSDDGRWLDITVDRDVLIVNVGEMLEVLSGGVLRATAHRVVEPEGRFGPRMSLPLFLHPRSDVVLTADMTASAFVRDRVRELRDRGWLATPGGED